MKIEYNNLYSHFIFTTLHRLPLISEKHREQIEKYITGVVNNNDSQLYFERHNSNFLYGIGIGGKTSKVLKTLEVFGILASITFPKK